MHEKTRAVEAKRFGNLRYRKKKLPRATKNAYKWLDAGAHNLSARHWKSASVSLGENN